MLQSRKTLLGFVSSCLDKTPDSGCCKDERTDWEGARRQKQQSLAQVFVFTVWNEKKKHIRMCRLVRRCDDGKRERARSIEKPSALRVKGQPPESVKATIVGTNQSQRHDHIDQMQTHISIVSDAHAHTQLSVYSHSPTHVAIMLRAYAQDFSTLHLMQRGRCPQTNSFSRLSSLLLSLFSVICTRQ